MPATAAPTTRREVAALATAEYVIGVDEVGRGAIAGPLVVGATALDTVRRIPAGLRDSKDLSPEKRESLVAPIGRWAAASATGSASVDEIETWGLRAALALAVDRALSALGLDLTRAHVIMDGPLDLLAPTSFVPALANADVARTPVIDADASCASVAAASVIAKVARDATMVALAAEHPPYLWEHNKGYGTAAHYAALDAHGPTPWHRLSWLGGRETAAAQG